MNTSRNSRIAGLTVVALALTLGSRPAVAEIVFVDLHDLPVEGEITLINGPFMAQISDQFCQWVWDNVGILFPGCYIANCGLFGDNDEDSFADRLAVGDPIGSNGRYFETTTIAGFDVVDDRCADDPNTCVFRPLTNDWFDRSGAPVRGYMAWGGSSAAGDPHYGWIELTVEYDAALEDFDVILHGYAYEDQPGTWITAGDRGQSCTGDLDGDGQVGLSDLAIMLANYGTAAGADPEDGDLDGDGDVDLTDLSELLGLFGTPCP